MAFWNRSDPHTASSQQNLERGGLPLLAERRIKAETEDPKRRFTSDLSVNELMLTHDTGYLPVSQVMGSSIYHVGWQYKPLYASSELSVVTQAYSHARLLALSRLQKEAKMLGAHGVIGVRIMRNAYDWAKDLIEFAVLGTAIRLPSSAQPERPFLSDLSGQEFWSLHKAGFRPAGIVFGNCVWYQVSTYATQAALAPSVMGIFSTSFYNQELPDFTKAVYHARRQAMSRMEGECVTFGGEGVVGVQVSTKITEKEVDVNDNKRTDLIVNFEAFGTAIARYEHGLVPIIDYAVSLHP
ncbi:MAG: heavy metal-binding domain-containing protein [Capsulimonadaceae bacterium]|nr:heavy metal-binding domain-containing protein [Capsulimonadaceae bacterium]